MSIVSDYLDAKKFMIENFKYKTEYDYPIQDMTDQYWVVGDESVRYNDTKKQAVFDYYENNLSKVEPNIFKFDGYTLIESKNDNSRTEVLLFDDSKMISIT